jgi:hypothetical protein
MKTAVLMLALLAAAALAFDRCVVLEDSYGEA